jgi:hypothetical protein
MVERGCARVIFTDADAILSNMDLPFQLNWTGSVSGSGRPKVLFGLGQFPQGDAVKHGKKVPGSKIVPVDSKWCQSDNPCGSFKKFWSCLNTGVFLMESTDEMHQFMFRVVHGMHKGTKGCTTASFNPWHTNQCAARGIHGDQCMIGCAMLRDNKRHGHDIDHMPDNFSCVTLQSQPRLQELVKYEWIGHGTHPMQNNSYVINIFGGHKRRTFMMLLNRNPHLAIHYNSSEWQEQLALWHRVDRDF